MRKLLALLLLLLMWEVSSAQSARLRVAGFNGDRFTARIGQTLTLEIFADLQGVTASGFSLFVSIPNGPFQVVDANEAQVRTQPFVSGPLFSGAGENRNILYSENESPANVLEGLQLQYAAVYGQGQNRQRTGSGILATVKLRCIKPILNGRLTVDDNPVLETFLTLPDGLTTGKFRTLQGVEVTVTGITLVDIPDVILLPDRADSTTIGSLNKYLENILSPVDSIRWSFEPTTFDSLTIELDPRTRVVKISPAKGWRGQRQVVWTATEAQGLLPGQPPLSASDVSRIVVNNPPRFVRGRASGGDGAKRDTVLMHEDLNSYIPGVLNNNRSRAFRALDLDTLVVDPDIIDPQTELDFAVLQYNSSDQPPTLAEKEEITHQLLIWSRPDFAGVDSFKVVVRDRLRGEDSLRVIVLVEEVPDAPHFLLTGQTLRISRGGELRIAIWDFLADPDTPLDRLQLNWDDDPGGHFVAQKTTAGDSLIFRGDSTFVGNGRFVFRAYNPLEPENLKTTLVLNITSIPEGISSQDTLKVTIGEKEGETRGGFQLKPLGALEVLVNQIITLDLDDYVQVAPEVSKADIEWLLNHKSTTHTLAQIDTAHVMQLFGLSPGTDTLSIAVQDKAGNKQVLSTTVRVLGQGEVVKLQSIPDIQFIANVPFTGLHLNEFVIDRQAHPDSVLVWSTRQVGTSPIIVQVRGDSVFAISTVVAEADWIFEVRDVVRNSIGRDTVRVFSLDPSTASRPLKDLPPITFTTTQEDSSLFLDKFLPDGVSRARVRWSVAGQRVTSPFIDPRPPHELHLKAVGDKVGIDTLRFAADLGGGFTATGTLLVTVTEPVDFSTLRLGLVPNPFNPEFIEVFVVARRTLAGTPNVVCSFEGSNSAVAVSQIEADLPKRGVLIWTGNVRLRPTAAGTVFFSTQATTALGTMMRDTASVAIAPVVAGKP